MNEDSDDAATGVDGPSDEPRTRGLLTRLAPGVLRRRYAAKFVVSILVVVIVIGTVGAVGYHETRDTVTEDTEDQLRSTATMQADSLAEWDRHMRGQTRTLARSGALDGDDPAAIRPRLRSQVNDVEAVKAVHYVDTENGTVVASTNATLDRRSLAELSMPWATTEIGAAEDVWWADESYLSPILHGHLVTAYAAPVPGEDRAVVVVGGLYHRLEDLHQPQTDQMTWIVDADGETVLAGDNTNDAAPGDTSGNVDRLLSDADEGDSGTLFDDDPDRHLVAYAPVEGTDWVAVTAVEKENAYAVRDGVQRSLLGVVGAALLSLLVVGAVLGRQTVTPLADLRRKAERMEEGDLDVDLRTHREDEIGRLYGSFAAMRDSLRERIERVTDAREEAEASLETTERTNRHLERQAEEYGEVMRACAAGDLTRRMEPDDENEAMADVAREFNEMMAELERTTARLKQFAAEVASASEEVTASTVEVSEASYEVSDSVEAISRGAERQDELLQSVNGEMGELAETIERIAHTTDRVADIAEQTATTGREGREAAQEAVAGMRRIEAENEETVAEIERLEAEIDRIDELTETITEIAEQTNLLALNANIEASRSGESGEGFAVVAEEVKELAADSKAAAQNIEDRIEEIKAQTGRAADEVHDTSEQIAAHADTVENAADALDEIADYARQTNEGVQRISATTDEQADSIRQVAEDAEDAATLSRKTRAEAESVTATAAQQTTTLAEVSRSADGLAKQATRLSDALDDFDTDAGVTIDPLDESGDAVDVSTDDD